MSQANRWPAVLGLAGSLLLAVSQLALAQGYTPRAVLPSRSSPSAGFGVGGVGRSSTGYGLLGEAQGAGSSVRTTNTPPSSTIGTRSTLTSTPRRSRSAAGGAGRVGASSAYTSGGLLGGGSSGSLLGSPYVRSSASRFASGRALGTTALGRAYSASLEGNWAMGFPTPRPGAGSDRLAKIRTWGAGPSTRPAGMPDAPSVPIADPSPPADLPSPPAEGASSGGAVRHRLDARRQAFMEQGWKEFYAGNYRKACGQFSLADAAVLDERDDSVAAAPGLPGPLSRAKCETRVALLYAQIAAQQYREASTNLWWLLKQTQPGQAAPTFLAYTPDLAERYGNATELARLLDRFAGSQVSAVSNAAGSRQAGGSVEMAALRAMVLWGFPADPSRRLEAMDKVKSLGDSGPSAKLYALMKATVEGSAPGNAGPVSPVGELLDDLLSTPPAVNLTPSSPGFSPSATRPE